MRVPGLLIINIGVEWENQQSLTEQSGCLGLGLGLGMYIIKVVTLLVTKGKSQQILAQWYH